MYVLFKYETYCFNLTTGLKFIPRLPGSRNQECKFYKGSHNSERVLKGDTYVIRLSTRPIYQERTDIICPTTRWTPF